MDFRRVAVVWVQTEEPDELAGRKKGAERDQPVRCVSVRDQRGFNPEPIRERAQNGFAPGRVWGIQSFDHNGLHKRLLGRVVIDQIILPPV